MLLLITWLIIVTVALVDVLLILALLGVRAASPLRQTVFATPFAVTLLTALMAPWGLWTLGVLSAVTAVQGAAHLVWLRRERQRFRPAPASLSGMVSALARRWATPAPAAVVVGPAGPAVTGFIRQTLILPPDTQDRPESELSAAIAHELAHLRSHDPLKLWLLGIARTALAWHPLTRLLADRLALEVEIAADHRAAGWVGLRQAGAPVVRPVVGLAGQGSDLMLRLKALLSTEEPAPHLAFAGPLGARTAASPRRPRLPVAVGLYLLVGYVAVFGLVQYLTR